MELYLNIARIILALLAVGHLLRKGWKPARTLAGVLVLSYVPALLNHWFEVQLDPFGIWLYIIVLVMTIYMGNSLKVYDRFAWWDRLIHLLSGILFVNFGVAFTHKVPGLPVFATVVFAVCFSLAGHCLWELLEYAADCFGRLDNQRWQAKNPNINHKPAAALQPAGLVDTMNDLLMGLIGALLAALLWWVIL